MYTPCLKIKCTCLHTPYLLHPYILLHTPAYSYILLTYSCIFLTYSCILLLLLCYLHIVHWDSVLIFQHVLTVFNFLQPVAVGELVAKRLEAAVRLQANPMDTVAMQTLAEVEAKTSQWCKSLVKPGQFTGATVVRPMSMKDHNTGYQAWAKKVPPWLAIITHSIRYLHG